TIRNISNYVEDTEVIRIQELSKYIESYPLIQIYVKPGPVDGSYVAYVYTHVTFYGHEDRLPGLTAFYVCTDENGGLYLNEGENPDDILEYIKTISLQDDVVDLNNKVNAEYNELILNNNKLFDYLSELEKEVSKATGEALAAQYAQKEAENSKEQDSGLEVETQESSSEDATEAPVAQGTVYATATTTVNVRSSDSEQADKLGKVSGGTRVQVTEQRANGWSKIIFEGKDGYIKSEYLQVEGAETQNSGVSMKTVKATTNVNLRREASESAEKIGVVVGGDSLEVLSESNGWSQVRYKGMVGFVKSEYVQ
ncbi:MAG: SH3 domain-containing protein, partial [Lachnospiraceae bacterium]|nr:SH3 domain-containing protein [Lachnospiraceae bacterium]